MLTGQLLDPIRHRLSGTCRTGRCLSHLTVFFFACTVTYLFQNLFKHVLLKLAGSIMLNQPLPVASLVPQQQPLKELLSEMVRAKFHFQNLLPFAAMATAQCIFTGLTVISKAAMLQGLSPFVFIVYSNGLSTIFLLLAHFFSRRISQPPITFLILGKLFILGLVGTTLLQNFMFTGINYSSPTLSSAITNVQPALTFVLAIIFRMEKVDIRCFTSQIKILGTVVSVSGALTMTLYKGPALWVSLPANPQVHNLLAVDSNWVFGGFCFAIVALSSATSNILQATILREYPSVIAVVMFYNLFGTIQCAVVSSIVERDLDAWKLSPDIKLAAIVCSGVGGSAACFLTVWCIGKKGPVYAALFSPMGIVIAALMGAIFLGDALHIGSVVGAIIIVSGFYAVIWGKSKDNEVEEEWSPSSSSQKIPLLPDH
uniref:EamA domain-containing protein n=1 Tax=Kalanchoe fedtschenkoi TaxID=63787 RepID=A0A7N1A921_KALFE